jgi:murein L,D-transpeptidase YafK
MKIWYFYEMMNNICQVRKYTPTGFLIPRRGIICMGMIFLSFTFPQDGFRERQKQNGRVKTAYDEKFNVFLGICNGNHIAIDQLEIFIRAYKAEGMLELWGKEKGDRQFRLLKEFPICASSGHAGPKRKEGDGQVPEGFYRLDNFNPLSRFYLSFSIDYPNQSDRLLGDHQHPGGNICIHGNCVTIGCIPITDEGIKELYVAAVEAKNNGQHDIPVAIFPCRLEEEAYHTLLTANAGNSDYCNLWTDMKKEYNYFIQSHIRHKVTVQSNGRYMIQP